MVSVRTALVLVCACLIPRYAAGEMREVRLDELTSLARLSFNVSRGTCMARPGPDGHSLRLACPEPRDNLGRRVRHLLRTSAIRAFVHRKNRGVVLELVIASPLGGYHLEQQGFRVTVDVGERSKRAEISSLTADVRVPLADDWDGERLAQLDTLFAGNKLTEAREILTKGRRGRRPELYQLRRADLELLEGELDVALESYLGTASRYRRRSAGMLAQVRYGEIAYLTGAQERVLDFTFLTPLPPQRPQRTAILAWLYGARLALWQGDYEEAFRLASTLVDAGTEREITNRARDIRDQAVAAMLQDASRLGDHERVAEVALTYRSQLAVHPGLDVLAPLAYHSLIRLELPNEAAYLLQALVAGSSSDDVVIEHAADLARAYLRAGKVYRASQVVDFALAVSSRRASNNAKLRALRAKIAITEGRGSDAASAVTGSPTTDPALQLRAAESAIHHDAAAAALPILNKMAEGKVKRILRGPLEIARAEAHLLTGEPSADELVKQVLERNRPGPQTARLGFWNARSRELSNDLEGARKGYAAVKGDPRWARLAAVASESIDLGTKVAPLQPPPEKGVNKVGRRRRKAAKAPEAVEPAKGRADKQAPATPGPGAVGPTPEKTAPVQAAPVKTAPETATPAKAPTKAAPAASELPAAPAGPAADPAAGGGDAPPPSDERGEP